MKTKERLGKALQEIGLKELAKNALEGEYDELEGHTSHPFAMLTFELGKINSKESCKFAERIIGGEFETPNEEARVWFESVVGGKSGLAQR